ncbi:AbrB/MazE/SpoVT family DNA-binding domain-containing protein [Nevskia sp.]|uniref:AbrB/MazE/SpoVT family DNA-binding domain-containing protein n=1 Tax=Nevskia sp. TaxID=1929292 RepID=UPI0025EF6E19|nr:AbrB/MazE/SpoVT family DNA-binding domain-containing protein [Nevskia sp.]
MNSTAVTSKGQVTIPQAVRRQLGIRQGSRVEFRLVDGHAELHVQDHPAEVVGDGFGMLTSSRKSLPADFDPASLLGPKR